MAKKFTDEEFQQFVVEQFGKVSADVHNEIEVVRSELRVGLAGVRGELQSGLADVRSELREGLAEARHEMQTGFRENRNEFAEIQTILKPLAEAFDKDTEKLIEHDRRIVRVEKHLGLGRA